MQSLLSRFVASSCCAASQALAANKRVDGLYLHVTTSSHQLLAERQKSRLAEAASTLAKRAAWAKQQVAKAAAPGLFDAVVPNTSMDEVRACAACLPQAGRCVHAHAHACMLAPHALTQLSLVTLPPCLVRHTRRSRRPSARSAPSSATACVACRPTSSTIATSSLQTGVQPAAAPACVPPLSFWHCRTHSRCLLDTPDRCHPCQC